jgi:L-histidine N-alpha-methyltransferase
MQEEVLAGLKGTPKEVSPKYFYDAKGSQLFDRICELPEYYQTRTEVSILEQHAAVISDSLGEDLCIIEPGAGSCHKARIFLETGRVAAFFPIDISADHLRNAAAEISRAFPLISVHAVAMDFSASLNGVEPLLPPVGKRLIFYPGSSIGNFDPPKTRALLSQFLRLLREDDGLLIGYDLRKSPYLLWRAYNDLDGVTAAFNLNILARFNRELGADFDLDTFRHVAFYDETRTRVEMHLESLIAQQVSIANERVSFNRFERIHTENSYKYSIEEFGAMAAGIGLKPAGVWTDPASWFAVGLYVKKKPG